MENSTKRNILIIIASIAGFLLVAVLAIYLVFNSQFSLYQDSQYGLSIRYPSNWKVIPHPKPNVAVVFLRPKDTAMDTLQENFNVTVQPLPDDTESITAFSAAIKRQMTGVFGKTIKVTEDKPFQWGWRQGHEMAIDAPKPDHLKLVNAWVIAKGQAYILTYLGDLDKYDKDGFIVDEMIRSFQIQ